MTVEAEVVPFACSTSTGTQDITLPGMGTPVGAILFLTRNTSADSLTDQMVLSVGATDGTRQRCATTFSEHNQGTSDTYREMKTTQVAMILDGTGAIDGEASFDSFITDGIRINWGNAPASAYLGFVVFILGNSQVYVGTGDNTSGNQDVTAPGFTPTWVFCASARNAFDTGVSANGAMSLGIATPTAQASLNWLDRDNLGTTECIMENSSSYAMTNFNNLSTLGAWNITNFDADGFSINQRGGAGTVGFYVAIRHADVSVHLSNDLTVLDSTGTASYNASGFQPAFAFTLCSWMGSGSWNALRTNLGDSLIGAGLGVKGGNVERSIVLSSEDAQATSDTSTELATSGAIAGIADHAGDQYRAPLTFTASGVDADFINPAPDATFRFAMLTIESSVPSGTVSMQNVTQEIGMRIT